MNLHLYRIDMFYLILHVLMLMKGKDKTAEERRIAICIFDDVAEQCREAALKYVPHNYQ